MLLMSLHLTQGVYIKQLFCTGLCEHWKGYQSGLKKKKDYFQMGKIFSKTAGNKWYRVMTPNTMVMYKGRLHFTSGILDGFEDRRLKLAP